MRNVQKLRIVIDDTLKPGQQLAQACHLMREWTENHRDLDNVWYKESNYIACLSAPPEKIESLIDRCKKEGIPFATFIEPDLNNRITGVVLAPCDKARKITSSLPLALKI